MLKNSFFFLISLHKTHFQLLNKQGFFAGYAQMLPDATLPIGKINSFSKMAITFEPIMIWEYSVYSVFCILCNIVYFMTGRAIFNSLCATAP